MVLLKTPIGSAAAVALLKTLLPLLLTLMTDGKWIDGRCPPMTPARNFKQQKFTHITLNVIFRSSASKHTIECPNYFFTPSNILDGLNIIYYYKQHGTGKSRLGEAVPHLDKKGGYQVTFASKVQKLGPQRLLYVLDTDNDKYWIIWTCISGTNAGVPTNFQIVSVLKSGALGPELLSEIANKVQELNVTEDPLRGFDRTGC